MPPAHFPCVLEVTLTKIIQAYLGSNGVFVKRMSKKEAHVIFIKECRAHKIDENQYPFCTSTYGKRSLYTFLKKLETSSAYVNSKRMDDQAKNRMDSTGSGESKVEICSTQRPYSVCQIDGHKIDCLFVKAIETPDGDIINRIMNRAWLLCLIDVATRAILGYSLSLNMEYDRFDVLSCVKNAIEPKVKMQFSVPGYKYPENGGFPTTAIPSLQWAVPEIIMMDNARSHLSSDVVSQLTSYLRCTVNFGPVSTPVSRGIIERTFGILEESGYHRIPSTTGSSQMDPRSKSAESDAIKYSISYEMIKETTELLIAQYNNTARDVLGNRSPLEVLESRIQCGMSPNYVQAQQREEFSLLSYTETRVVRGSLKSGKHPYIQFEGVEYQNKLLSGLFSLCGSKAYIRINPDDLRQISAYKEDGSPLGILRAKGKWKNTKHSLRQRRLFNRLKTNGTITLGQMEDPIDILNQHLNKQQQTKRVARNIKTQLEQNINTSRSERMETDNLQVTELISNKNNNNILAQNDKAWELPAIIH